MGSVSAGDPLGLSGQILHDQFRVGELADDSPRSLLYKGVHVGSNVPVALKFLKVPSGGNGEAFVKRFRHESRLHFGLAQASPHVVRVLASGSTTPETTGILTPFTVLEWLHGRTLAADFAERRAHWGKGRAIGEAIALLDGAVEALAVAHFHGIVHREVTPTHLFLSETNQIESIKVLDFGLAKLMGETPGDDRALTVDMGPLASPIYAAPEQFSREVGMVGPSTDLYSLMMIFLEALRDKAVMDETSSPLAIRVLDPQNRPTPRALGISVGDNLELTIAQAVAVKPRDRPQDLGEFWANLKHAALKDARKASISSPPSMHARGIDAMPVSEATEVQVNVSFLRPSRAVTIPNPEPATLSRPFDESEPVSSFGEMFAMMPIAQESIPTPRVQVPPRAKTLLSPGQTHPDDLTTEPNALKELTLKATLVSTGPRPSGAPLRISEARNETPIIPFDTSRSTPPVGPVQPAQVAPTSPWLTMLIVFVICVVVLSLLAALILR